MLAKLSDRHSSQDTQASSCTGGTHLGRVVPLKDGPSSFDKKSETVVVQEPFFLCTRFLNGLTVLPHTREVPIQSPRTVLASCLLCERYYFLTPRPRVVTDVRNFGDRVGRLHHPLRCDKDESPTDQAVNLNRSNTTLGTARHIPLPLRAKCPCTLSSGKAVRYRLQFWRRVARHPRGPSESTHWRTC